MPGLGAWCVAVSPSEPSASLSHTGLVPPTDTPEKREMLLLVEMGR